MQKLSLIFLVTSLAIACGDDGKLEDNDGTMATDEANATEELSPRDTASQPDDNTDDTASGSGTDDSDDSGTVDEEGPASDGESTTDTGTDGSATDDTGPDDGTTESSTDTGITDTGTEVSDGTGSDDAVSTDDGSTASDDSDDDDDGPVDADLDDWPAHIDCDDTDPTISPTAPELCDGIDNDCDGEIDEDAIDRIEVFVDADDDGYGAPTAPILVCMVPASGYSLVATDCDDTDATAYPGHHEDRCDGKDNDCDSTIDEDAPFSTWFSDDDGDGYGDPSTEIESCLPLCAMTGVEFDDTCAYTRNGDDCDDRSASVYPGAVDEADDDECMIDEDGDGYGSDSATERYTTGSDCNDSNPGVNPDVTDWFDTAYTYTEYVWTPTSWGVGGVFVEETRESYDYNCDGEATLKLPNGTVSTSDPCTELYGPAEPDCDGGLTADCMVAEMHWVDKWQGPPKGCGESGTFIEVCRREYEGWTIFSDRIWVTETVTTTQTCQ